MEQEIKEFKVFNKNIEQISVYYGFFLIIWGVAVSFISGSSSFTSYIPSYIGLMILTFSFLSVKFLKKKKIFHAPSCFTWSNNNNGWFRFY